MTDTGSAWAPLSQPVFRLLWGVWLVANLSLWLNDVAAAWMMTNLTSSPTMVALVQTASTLPVFLLGLPSGALADIVDRRRYFMLTQIWVAAIALILCVTIAADAMTAPMLLFLTLANGVGLAMRWPVFAAIVPDIVPRAQLPAALALNAISMNASRIAGPIIAGAIIASLGTVWVFALNAVLGIGAAIAIGRWKRPRRRHPLPGERFLGAIRVGVQYVRQSSRMHTVMIRVVACSLTSIALIALLPLVAKQMPGGNAGTFTLLLASMGAGAILAAWAMPRIRGAMNFDQVLSRGIVMFAVGMIIVSIAPNVWVAVPAMAIAGMAWISVMNTLTICAQLGLPDWVRARGMSIYQMALMGSLAGGAAIWGGIASIWSVPVALQVAAAGALASLLIARQRTLAALEIEENLAPVAALKAPVSEVPIDPHAGPVVVTMEYRIDPERADEFRELMQQSRRSRLARGTLSWELLRDTKDPGKFVEYFVDESWVEHLRRFERLSAADLELRDRKYALHVGDEPPKVTRFVAERVSRH